MSKISLYKKYMFEAMDYWGSAGAGCLFIARDTGRILVALRSSMVDQPETWGTIGGKIDRGENPKDAAEREVKEETGLQGGYKLAHIYTYKDGDFRFYNYIALVPKEFDPNLSWETDDYKWVEYGDWPEPMHFGLEELIKHSGYKIKRIIDIIKSKKKRTSEDMNTPPPPPPAIIRKVDIPSPSGIMNRKDMNDALLVVATIWREARSEGEKGMQAILNVIMNRSKNNFNNAKDIILKSKQFTTWNGVRSPETIAIKMASMLGKDREYQIALKLVDKAMKGSLPDVTGGATYYYNPKHANPSWVKQFIKTISIGKHRFYKVPQKLKKYNIGEISIPEINITPKGLVDNNTYEYELKSPYSYLRYRHDKNTNTFYLDNVGTPKEEDKHKGHAKELLTSFFQIIKQNRGILDPGSYTTSGEMYVKPVVDKLSEQYNVRLV